MWLIRSLYGILSQRLKYLVGFIIAHLEQVFVMGIVEQADVLGVKINAVVSIFTVTTCLSLQGYLETSSH